MKWGQIAGLLFVSMAVQAKAPFYVYKDKGSPENHFCPSGWMGSYKEIKYDDSVKVGCKDGSCIQVSYAAQGDLKWAGIFWQNPCSNWGSKDGGYNLNDYTRVTFWAKGLPDKNGLLPRIEEFKIGGITGEFPDSGSNSIGPIELTKDWKQYTIKLSDMELSKISGGFCWSASADYNQNGMAFLLDDIVYQ